jgi:hypothetical protein
MLVNIFEQIISVDTVFVWTSHENLSVPVVSWKVYQLDKIQNLNIIIRVLKAFRYILIHYIYFSNH